MENRTYFTHNRDFMCLLRKMGAPQSSAGNGEVVHCGGGGRVPTGLGKHLHLCTHPVISLEVDTRLSEKEGEVIPFGFRIYRWRCRALGGRIEVEKKVD